MYEERMDMDDMAIKIVENYIHEHLGKSKYDSNFYVNIILKSDVGIYCKYCLSAALIYDMYWELTYDSDRDTWSLDVYKKLEHKEIEIDRE